MQSKPDNTASAAPAVTEAVAKIDAAIKAQYNPNGSSRGRECEFIAGGLRSAKSILETALSASSTTEAQAVERPERVQAAFEVWREHPETGPNASALFEYIETLEAAIRAAK